MKKSIMIAATLFSVALIASNAFAWGHGGYGRGCRGGAGYGVNGGPAMPNLTEEQKTRLSDLHQKFIDDTYELRSSMMNKRQDMQMLLETSSPDRGKLTAMSDAISDLQKQMATKRIDYILEAKKIAPELNMGNFMGFGRGAGFNMGKRFGGGNGPCPGFERSRFQGGNGAAPCAAMQTSDQ